MRYGIQLTLLMFAAILIMPGCGGDPSSQPNTTADRGPLVGAWHSRMAFSSGPLAEMKGLEFLYAYNAGGTMTESSNYDEAANSSPPAYGVWKQVDPRTFDTKYMFFTTKAPGSGDGAVNGNDWWPDGHGELSEKITMSADGQSYASTITLRLFDKAGAPIAGSSVGTGAATRIVF